MMDSAAIQMEAQPRRGLYESFYFRGQSVDGRLAFWLKHNMLRHEGSDEVALEGALILFDRERNRTRGVYSRQPVDGERFARTVGQARDWEHVALDAPNGSVVEIGRQHLRGRLVGEGGYAEWELQVHREGLQLLHFPHEWMYRARWPRKKLVTRECHMDFRGTVRVGDMSCSGVWHGMNGHNWGSEHAHAYAYANCAAFDEVEDAYFDGFSARVSMAGGRLISPWMSMASLYCAGRWWAFNAVLDAVRHRPGRVDDYGWDVALSNGTHRLEVTADGATPGTLPWVALHYEHPDRKRSVVKNTKFARLHLRLSRLADGGVEQELSSDACELETLLPHNRPDGPAYFGAP